MKRKVGTAEPGAAATQSEEKTQKPGDNDGYYFDSYAHISIHEEMIKDRSRTSLYRKAMVSNKADFTGKVVADVGCGSSILSFFAREAGAKKVFGIDASNIVDYAKLVVEANKAQDVITLIKSKAEEVELPEKVDIIISEWMGYALLYEAMLPSVLAVRDKWLKPGGMIYPRFANMYLVPFTDEEYYDMKVNFWGANVYGVDFRALQPLAKKCAFTEPAVEILPGQDELAFPVKIATFDSLTVTLDDLKHISKDFKFAAIINAPFHGFALWFDVVFDGTTTKVTLDTSPSKEPTHWKQVLFYFDEVFEVDQDEELLGKIDIRQNEKNPRFLDFEIEFTFKDKTYKKKFDLH